MNAEQPPTHAGAPVTAAPVPHPALDSIVVPTRRSSRLRVYIALGAIVAALGFVVINGLGEASQFYRPVDEALAKADEIGTKRFSIIGLPVEDTVTENGKDVRFTIEYNGAEIPVRHTGVPPELFQPGVAVVLDGRFETIDNTRYFVSDRMAVQHGNEYKSENPDRVKTDLSDQ
jgi:cytochrome c-type biogenesis protein CcmE